MRHGATESVRRGAADEDRRPRRPRAEEERLAVCLDHVVGEAAVDEGERLVGERPAASQIDPEGAELRRHPADADPEEEPPAGKLLHGRDRLGRRQRWTVGKHEDARPEANTGRRPSQVRQRRERVEVPALGSLRVVGRDGDVVGDPEVGDRGGRVDRARTREDRLARRLRSHVAEDHANLHGATVALHVPVVNGRKEMDEQTGRGPSRIPAAAARAPHRSAAAPESLPEEVIDQLAEGGRCIIPVGREYQHLWLLQRVEGQVIRRQLEPVQFVPLRGSQLK